MNCHNNHNNEGNHKHSPTKHMLHMIICCGLPIVIIALLPFIANVSPGMAGILALIAPFLCPIMMVGMMGMMFVGNRKKKPVQNELEIKEQNK